MAFNKSKFVNMEPMRYWSPDEEMGVEADIMENPDNYSDYIGAFKKDGEWSMMVWDGKEVIIRSRSISKKTGEYARKEASLPHLVEVFKKLPKATVLLGELCYDDLYKRSKDVGSILRSLPALAIEKQAEEENKLNFYCFDVLCWGGTDLTETPFETRITFIDKVKDFLGDNKTWRSARGDNHIRFAEYKTIEEIVTEYDDYLAQGGEGFVLQLKDNPYLAGKRSAWKTIKLKKHTEEIECPIIGFIDPEKEYTGKELENWTYFVDGQPVTKYYFNGWKAGVIVDNNGAECRVASGITDEDACWLASEQAKKLLKGGQLVAKCSAMEIEPDTGRMRHPRLIEIREYNPKDLHR